MKRFALNLILGVAIVAGSSFAAATTTDPKIKNTSASLTETVLCALGFSSYCADIDVTRDPTIVNN